jgi:hypothetical protein
MFKYSNIWQKTLKLYVLGAFKQKVDVASNADTILPA